ncbi:uncharacterized protein FTJAE_12703 [Fusarium tjaetaba]|uniref:Uncharacterized protein n=1 Tax=Fusarium tjaetaba TaxID=1567544 RepID=A0A8H5VBC3_9HYPO|nr:uncharacterized protein FTJAE_12703 [Fusarium tjaetaba]KAF5617281.1 hypothetical protein FTJAE_12703 [Fusarium tjaetaba]
MIIILASIDSPEDVQSLIRADPYALCVFLEHKQPILQSLRRDFYQQSCSQSLTQALMIYRLRRYEYDPHCQARPQAIQFMKPLFTSLPERCTGKRLNLGALSKLSRLTRESQKFEEHYRTRAREMHPGSSPSGRKHLRMLSLDSGLLHGAYLLFEAYRHTLWFSTNLLQDYGSSDSRSDFNIPWNFIYRDKLLCVRTFQTFFVFVFREYENLLSQVHSRACGSHYLYRFDSDWCIQRREFLHRGPRDRLQFAAYLSSLGCLWLLNIQNMDDVAQEEYVTGLYMRYLDFKADRQNCPMVVGADLERSLRTLCYREWRGRLRALY